MLLMGAMVILLVGFSRFPQPQSEDRTTNLSEMRSHINNVNIGSDKIQWRCDIDEIHVAFGPW